MTSVSEPQISPADGSLTCNLPTGQTSPGDSPCDRSNPACTPIHSRYHTTERYGINDFSRSRIYTVLALTIAPYILGPMPPDAFLDRFLPSHSISIPEGTPNFQEGIFASMLPPTDATGAAGRTGAAGATDATAASGVTKPGPYSAIKDSLQPFLPALEICITAWSEEKAANSRFPIKVRPDCSVYSEGTAPESTNSSLVEFLIEYKSQPYMDPFVVLKNKSSTLKTNSFVKDSTEGISNLGQITSYATSHLGAQFRTHVFLVLIVHNYARIIRWDRGGAVVTAPIRFNKEPHLFDFFVRYNYANPDIRGSDSSVRAPEVNELDAATRLISEFRTSGLDKGKAKTFSVVSIPRRECVNESDHYVVETPIATLSPPTGRATRTFIAYDIQRNKRVLIKDSWRINIIGMPKEGNIYAKLEDHQVPNIPFCSNSGDIGDDAYHSTQTHFFLDADWALSPKPRAEFTPHRHYRVVLDTIGTPLERFECSRDMVRAIRASLLAHKAAYQSCGILHRDISPSNILISRENADGGLLIDWDLCKEVNSTECKARRAARTGTWQFMAADLIADPTLFQGPVHDLESAFYVMFWLSLKYLPNSYVPSKRGLVLSTVFNPAYLERSNSRMSSSTNHSSRPVRGDDSRVNWMANSNDINEFEVTGNGPLSGLLLSLKTNLGRRHLSSAMIDKILKFIPEESSDSVRRKLSDEVDYSEFLMMLDAALAMQWRDDDSAHLQEIHLPSSSRVGALSGSKRSRSIFFASHNSLPVHSEPSEPSKRQKN